MTGHYDDILDQLDREGEYTAVRDYAKEIMDHEKELDEEIKNNLQKLFKSGVPE